MYLSIMAVAIQDQYMLHKALSGKTHTIVRADDVFFQDRHRIVCRYFVSLNEWTTIVPIQGHQIVTLRICQRARGVA